MTVFLLRKEPSSDRAVAATGRVSASWTVLGLSPVNLTTTAAARVCIDFSYPLPP